MSGRPAHEAARVHDTPLDCPHAASPDGSLWVGIGGGGGVVRIVRGEIMQANAPLSDLVPVLIEDLDG